MRRAAGVALVMLAAMAAGTALAQRRPVQAVPEAPPLSALPEGRLQLFAGNSRAANFIALDQTKKTGNVAEVWYLTVTEKPYPIGQSGVVAETLTHTLLDCAGRTFEEISSEGYSPAGERVVWLPHMRPEPVEARSTQDFIAKVLCDGAVIPDSNTVLGHKAAIAMTQRVFARSAN